MDWTQLLSEQSVLALAQLALGYVMKPQLQGKFVAAGHKATSLVPLLNLILAYAGFSLAPATAHAAEAAGLAHAGLGVFGMALLQTLFVTGTHSTLKNTVVPALKTLVLWGAKQFASSTD